MAWYDALPLDFTRAETREAESILVRAYPMTLELLQLAETAGVNIALLHQMAPPALLLRDLLGKARSANRLRTFLATVLSDASREAFHAPLLATMPGAEADLRVALLERRPTLAALSVLPPSIEVRIGADQVAAGSGALERLVNAAAPATDIRKLRRWLAEAEFRTARILARGEACGTGFLLAPDLLLTNCHVAVSAGVEGEAQFDHVRGADGAAMNEGRRVRFHGSWEVVSSPHLAPSLELSEDGPPAGAWDYALVRLSEPVGAEPVGAGGDVRGWFRIERGPYEFHPDEPLLIVGHPEGGPMQVAYASPALSTLTRYASRVRYVANTEPGSSGSPVFNKDFRIVALHHAGGRHTRRGRAGPFDGKYNQGIPIERIVSDLRARLASTPDVLSALGV